MKTAIVFVFVFLTGMTCCYSQVSADSKEKKPESPAEEHGLPLGMKGPELKPAEWLSAVPDMKGKFVALDFWGTRCKPCIAGFAHVNELHKKFKDKIVFIAATTNEQPEEVYVFNNALIQFYSMMLNTESWMEFKVHGIPHMVVMDPQGIVQFAGNGHDLTEAMLVDIFAKYGK